MKKRVIALLTLLLLLLCACTPAAPVATPTPEPTATPAPTPTPEPTPTPFPSLPPSVNPPDESGLSAKFAFVYDCSAGQLLYHMGDQYQAIAPASLTKLLTCLVALEYLDEKTVVTAGEEVTWIEEGASVAAVFQDYQLTVEMLVEGIMLQSGNDAALALSVAAGRVIKNDPNLPAKDALDAFMAKMNETADELGLYNTHFLYPDGRDMDGHYSCPADLLTVALKAMEEPTIMRYANEYRRYVVYTSGQGYVYLNTNQLLNPKSEFYCQSAIGLKTGTTEKAGCSLISAFRDGERVLLIGVFGCPEKPARFADTLTLYNHYK